MYLRLLPQEIYSFLAEELKSLAATHGERLLHTPHNPISLGKPQITDPPALDVLVHGVELFSILPLSSVSGRPAGKQRQGGDSPGLHAVHPAGVGSQVHHSLNMSLHVVILLA